MEIEPPVEYRRILCKRLAFELPSSSLIPACGCYIRDRRIVELFRAPVAVPLKHVDYSVDIHDNLASIRMVQDYTNPLDEPLELEYSFPVNPNICLYRFSAKFNEFELMGVVQQKEQAKKKYQQGLKEGKQVAYAAVDELSKDIVNMKIGNVPGGANVKITIEFLQMLEVSLNTFWQLMIPSTISPRYMNDKAPPFEFPEMAKFREQVNVELPKYTWSFKLSVSTNPNKRIVHCQSRSHDLLQLSINESKTQTTFVMEESCVPNRDFYFSYATENFNEPTTVLGRTDVSISAALSFIPKFCDLTINDAVRMQLEGKDFECDMDSAKGEYLFLLDRSGSMGTVRMDKAKEALSFFLRSLPQDIYFNIYTFGDGHRTVFPNSSAYSSENLKVALKQISTMRSDMGGTNIQTPLQAILSKPPKAGYPRQVFVLTDGGVNNTQRIIELVKNNTKYSRVHTIGVGNGASVALIQGCAEKGKGKYIFIQDNENVSGKIIELLGATLSPVIADFAVDFDEKVVQSISPNPKSMPYILKNEPVCFFIAFKPQFEGETKVTLRYQDSLNKLPYEKTVAISSKSDTSLAAVNKMVHHKALSLLCEKLNDEKSLADDIYLPKVKDLKKYIVDSSVKNQVLCSLTAFICVGKAVGDAEQEKMKLQTAARITVPQHIPVQYERQRGMAGGSRGRGGARPQLMMRSSHALPKMPPTSMVVKNERHLLTKKKQTSSNLMSITKSCSSRRLESSSCDVDEDDQDQIESPGLGFDQAEMMEAEEQCMRMPKAAKPKAEMMKESKELAKPVKKDQHLRMKADRAPTAQNLPAKEKDVKTGKGLEALLDQQQTNGSWLYTPAVKAVLQGLGVIQEAELKALQAKYKNMSVVVTYLIVNWLQAHHNLAEYQLILRKAKSWLSKSTKQAIISEEDLKSFAEMVQGK